MAQNHPKLEPRWFQDPPTCSQDASKIPQLGAKMAPGHPNLEPRWPQDPTTWTQDGTKTLNLEPRWPQDLQLGAPPPPKNIEKQMMFMYFSMFLLGWPSCIQSIKQSIDQEINQAINQTANQSVNLSNVR